MLVLALASLLALPPGDDDVVPAALDALHAAPKTVGITDIPFLLDASEKARVAVPGQVRCMLAVPDLDGDGSDDLVLGASPDAASPRLSARSGRTLALLWSAPVPGGFRTLRGLSARDGLLALGTGSSSGRVELRELAAGALLWHIDLAPAAPANVNAVELVDDHDGDGSPDVLVAVGTPLHAVLLLSSSDGTPLWTAPLPGPAIDVRLAHDLDGDGLADVLVAGGEEAPFARLLSAADGALLWEAALDGPGSAVLPLADDIDGDGVRDVAVGQFAAPAPCLLALSGADGARLWEATDVRRDVTSLRLLADLLDTGFTDVAVGSFDNAVSAVLALNGVSEWRTEASTVNGGSMPAIEVVGDLNLDGLPDVLAASVDEHAYVIGGRGGQFIARLHVRGRVAAAAVLDDADGDGRRESAVAGERGLVVLAGDAGTAGGPVVQAFPPRAVGAPGELTVAVWAYPAYEFLLLASLGTGDLGVPGFAGTLGLDLGTLAPLATGLAPGAGISGFNYGVLARDLEGVTVHLQAVTFHGPSTGIIGPPTSFVVPRP